MDTEIEAKWLRIDIESMRQQLKELGAVLKQTERLMVRQIFDYPDEKLGQSGGWVRVRNESDKITLSYKQLNDRSLHGTQEVTVVVDSFENTCAFLSAIGLESKSYQETRRESWELAGAQIELDTWPWIPSFIEIEAASEELLRSVAAKLQLDYGKALHGSVETAYQDVYDVTEEEIDHWPEIRFTEVPAWLASKAKQSRMPAMG